MHYRFLDIFTEVMGIEGGGRLHEVAGDPGGRTVWGVAERFHPEMFDPEPPTLDRAIEFYWDSFWVPLKLDGLVYREVQYEIFEMTMHTGDAVGFEPSVECAQKAVNDLAPYIPGLRPIADDGRMGPNTRAALNSVPARYLHAWRARFNYHQQDYYSGLREELKRLFWLGWIGQRT